MKIVQAMMGSDFYEFFPQCQTDEQGNPDEVRLVPNGADDFDVEPVNG